MIEADGLTRTPDPVGRRFFWLALMICSGIIGLGILSRWSASYIWDDAYMFTRYADNIMAYKKMCWNPAGEATYGLTSVLFLLVVLPLRFLVPDNPALAVALSSLASGIIFVALLVLLLERYTDAVPTVRRVLIGFILFAFAASIESLAAHFVSGMDTTFVLAYITAYILFSKWHERSNSVTGAVLMGIWGGLAFLARPDMLIYAFIVPASMIVFAPDRKVKRYGLMIVVVTAITVGVQVWLADRFLNSPLPLPFYAKVLRTYGDYITQQYRLVPIGQLLLYFFSYWYFFVLIGVAVFSNFKRWAHETSAVEKGLLIATILFIVYYLFFVLQILYFDQRFYYPVLPAVAYLACQSAVSLIGRISPSARQELQNPSRLLRALVVLFFVVSLLPAVLSITRVVSEPKSNLAHFTALDGYRSKWLGYWFRLDEFSSLPDNLVIATTEVGHPVALNPNKTIVDMAGLNETNFAHKGFSANVLFQKYQPDLIYMPHPHYKDMIEQITGNPYFSEHYDYFSAEELDVVMGVALWRDSKYYPAMRGIVEIERGDSRADRAHPILP